MVSSKAPWKQKRMKGELPRGGQEAEGATGKTGYKILPRSSTISYLPPAGFYLLKVSNPLKRVTQEPVEAMLVSNSSQTFQHQGQPSSLSLRPEAYHLFTIPHYLWLHLKCSQGGMSCPDLNKTIVQILNYVIILLLTQSSKMFHLLMLF